MQVKKQELELDMKQQSGSKLRKEYIMQNAKLDEAFVLMYGKTNTIS